MKYVKFVQSGNYEQSDNNGMSPYVYSIGAAESPRNNFRILTDTGLSGPDWSIPEEYATSFKLEFVLEKKKRMDDIPF